MVTFNGDGGDTENGNSQSFSLVLRWRKFLGILLLWMSAITLVGAWGIQSLGDVIGHQQDQIEVRAARQCINQWDTIPAVRRTISLSVTQSLRSSANIGRQITDKVKDLPELEGIDITEPTDERNIENEIQKILIELDEAYPDPTCDENKARATIQEFEDNHGYQAEDF